ncbi:MAG: energy-coupling factor transporter transmembrane component T [Oscillospiraceae bacterium]
MTRLPTGMFIPGNSSLHQLDARIKLLSLLALLAAVVNTHSLIGYGVLIAISAGIILLSGLPLKTVAGSAFRMYLFFILIFMMNACFFSTNGAWFSLWIIHPSSAGVLQGVNVVLRVFFALLFCNVLTCVTSPMEVSSALESLFSPLRLVRIPTDQIAMIISVAIAFIPVLFEEADMIRKAQTARGATFDSPKLTEKAAAVMPLTIPIFIGAFRRADELSLAMEARGYSSGGWHKKRKAEHLRFRDYAAFVSILALCILQSIFM